MKEQILELRAQGKSYREIEKTLGCSKSTISYHCGDGQKAKYKSRNESRKEKKNKEQNSMRDYLRELSHRYQRMCGCKVCGIKNPVVLQFDHINSEDKLLAVSQMISDRYSVGAVKKEIRKCQVLCANCHLIKTAKDLNYKVY